jgi:hypothetical protein
MNTELPSLSGADTSRTGNAFSRILVVFFSVSLSFGGCGGSDLPPGITKKAISFDQVPTPLLKAARKSISNVDFKEAWQNLDAQGKLHSYEIRGRQASDGKIREVRVSTAGEILESE